MQCFDTFRGFLQKLYAATMDGKGREGTYNFFCHDDWGQPGHRGQLAPPMHCDQWPEPFLSTCNFLLVRFSVSEWETYPLHMARCMLPNTHSHRNMPLPVSSYCKVLRRTCIFLCTFHWGSCEDNSHDISVSKGFQPAKTRLKSYLLWWFHWCIFRTRNIFTSLINFKFLTAVYFLKARYSLLCRVAIKLHQSFNNFFHQGQFLGD